VVLEWGSAIALDPGWRLAQRHPSASPEARAAALVTAKQIEHEAYVLLGPAWPTDPGAVARDVDETSREVQHELARRYPGVRASLLGAVVSRANYYHAK
jgi:hypothetical protein